MNFFRRYPQNKSLYLNILHARVPPTNLSGARSEYKILLLSSIFLIIISYIRIMCHDIVIAKA